MTLEENVKEFAIPYFGLGDKRQGIVHVIGPEQGFTLPGTTVVCGDSHTSTHGAFGALAFGIGTSETEHVLATQTMVTRRNKNMRVQVDGPLLSGVSSKDVILHIISKIGISGGTGCVIEYCGSTIRDLSMEARMSICNMSIEAGARGGMIEPDEKTFDYVKGRPLAPKGADWDTAVNHWRTLFSDQGATYDVEVLIDAKDIAPSVSWGTTPECVVPITGCVPDPKEFSTKHKQESAYRMLEYMGLLPGTPMEDVLIARVFIGSCTNSRMEDLRAAAQVVRGRKVAANVKQALVVPGSGLIKKTAEAEGLDRIFLEAGFEWREAGCSMCLGMNADILSPRERCASTSNRNFEGRQGVLGRTHLMSPVMAAAAAVEGRLTDVRKLTASDGLLSQTHAPQPHDIKSIARDEVDPNDRGQDIAMDSFSSGDTNTDAATSATQGTPVGLPKFTVCRGVAAPLERADVDTDTIIPKQFLKGISRTGLARGLFFDHRFNQDGSEKDFVLNTEPYRKSKILVVTGSNFGCGSSREHAPWAILDFGIGCIIAPSFADIFFNNCFQNGLLPIAITKQSDLEMVAAEAHAGRELEVNLPEQTVSNASGALICHFEVEAFRKHCLINGLDNIGLTLQKTKEIETFEHDNCSIVSDKNKESHME